MFERFRYRTAFQFGGLEHFFSRLLFFMLVGTFILHYNGYYDTAQTMLIADIVVWIFYWLCHRLEKFFHPNH